jgi:hypothetical protein
LFNLFFYYRYYRKWKDDTDRWDNTIIPVVEEKIKQEWKYSNKSDEDEIIPDEVEENG